MGTNAHAAHREIVAGLAALLVMLIVGATAQAARLTATTTPHVSTSSAAPAVAAPRPAVAAPRPAAAPTLHMASLATAAPASPGYVVATPASSWAVLVGVSQYDAPTHPTFGGDGDVATFRKLLYAAGWSDSHVIVLTDQDATADAIRQAMNWLVAHSSPSTFSVFHYSGHVYQHAGHEFMWGVDNNFISDDEFGGALQPLQGRAWIDISGCESAGFDKGLNSPLRLFSASSAVTEKSYEEPGWNESVWTGIMADEGMLQHQAGSGPISIQQAVAWAQPMATDYTSGQQPHGPQHPYALGGDAPWYLGPPVAPPPPKPAPPKVPASPASPGKPAPQDVCAALTLGFVRCGG